MNPRLFLLAALLAATALQAALPDAVPYQGRIAANGTNYTGSGQFKFAIYQHATGAFIPASASVTTSGGYITIVTIVSGGSGYSATGVTVSFTGGGGNGATATATVANGVITAVSVTNPGSGYTSTPTVVLTDPAAPAQLWNNAAGATTGALAEPTTAVSLPVTNGLYIAGLGDTALANMTALPASLAPAAGKRAFVRVWFNDGVSGFQILAPDTELRSVPFAREAANTASIGGVSLANLPQLNAANTFTNVNGITVIGTGPAWKTPVASAAVPVSGAGTRMEFLPGYSAFRAGTVLGTEWDVANIGIRSTAMGCNTTASGFSSTALGFSTTASGEYSTAMGSYTIASHSNTTAMGINTTATGPYSTAMGSFTHASGVYSTAMGGSTMATGDHSTAMGFSTTASGNYSTAMGYATTAKSSTETAIGFFNTDYTPANTKFWNSADRLFVIGNGTSDSARSDALVMLKSGDTTANGNWTFTHVSGLTVKGAGPVWNGPSWGPASGATVPIAGPGTRMEFIPGYSAFRAGTAYTTEWDAANIGVYSTALGYGTTASADHSTALGVSTTASGIGSTAMGGSTSAKSFIETALGRYNTDYTPASATTWVADDRLFVIGNGTSDSARSDALIVYKNGNATLLGALTQGSDRNRKTDIVPADTTAVLAKVAALPLATWKYKDDTATHLGPMAQDFAAAFHLGSTDTGIATVDADGVALASIQELNKRVTVLTEQNAAREARLTTVEAQNAVLLEDNAAKDVRLTAVEAQNAAKDARIASLENELAATKQSLAARLAALEAKLAK
jgi:hypothetical protein